MSRYTSSSVEIWQEQALVNLEGIKNIYIVNINMHISMYYFYIYHVINEHVHPNIHTYIYILNRNT